MRPRPLGQIWQFGLGSVWSVIGVLSLLAFSGLHYFLPPPSVDELRPVSGVLVGRVVVHRPSKGGLWASFALRGTDATLDARINNYGFLWNCDDTPRLLQIESGAEITAWFTAKDIAERTNALAWRIQHAGEELLTFDQALKAHQAQERRYFQLSLGILVIGAALALWGWRISLAEQRRVGNVL